MDHPPKSIEDVDSQSIGELAFLEWLHRGGTGVSSADLRTYLALERDHPEVFREALQEARPGDTEALSRAMLARGVETPPVPRARIDVEALPVRQAWQPFDVQARSLFVGLVREGRSRSDACRALGLHRSTLGKWTRRGRQDQLAGLETAQACFLAALVSAEAQRPRRQVFVH